MKTKFCKQYIENDYISEKELSEVFQNQYNDTFHNLLKYDINKIINILQKQVNLHLQIINKKVDNSSFQKMLSIYIQKYIEDKEKVMDAYQLINNNPKKIIYLDYINCFIHCIKCKNALHKCGHKFVINNNYIFCITCKEVYNEFQIHMYCKECKEEYYTKLREIKNEKEMYDFPVAYKKCHCYSLDFEEKIKCEKCKNDLFFALNSEKNRDKINEIFCKNCKSIYDVNKMSNICPNCKKNFHSDAKIYNYFPSIKVDLLSVIHSLYDPKNAFSFVIMYKQCKCNLHRIEKLKHSDGGDLLLGNRLDKKVIICNKCCGLFNLNCFDWVCPICKGKIGVKKENIYETKKIESISNRNVKSLINYQVYNDIIYKSPNLQKNDKNKAKHNTCHSNNFSKNSLSKKNDNKSNSIIKTNNSASFLQGKENNLSKSEIKNHPEIDLSEKVNNTRNDIKKLINKKMNELNTDNSTNNKTSDDLEPLNEIFFNMHKYQKLNNNLKKVSFEKSKEQKNSLYNSHNTKDIERKKKKIKDTSKEKINDIKKKLLFQKVSKDKNISNKIVHKNFSEKNNLVLNNKKDYDNNNITKNEICKTSSNTVNNDNTKKSIDRKKTLKINRKRVMIQTSSSLNKKPDNENHPIHKVNTLNNGRINNINSNNKNKLNNRTNKYLKIFDSTKDTNKININIKINNSNNNIININNNYINDDNKIKRINNYKINKKLIKTESIKLNIDDTNFIRNSVRKNSVRVKSNLNNSLKNNYNLTNKKNHLYIKSDLNNSNIKSSNSNLKNRKKTMKRYITDNNMNRSKLSEKRNSKIKIKTKLSLDKNINSSKKNLFSKTNTTKRIFKSDDYNIIDLIGEGTYGKIYLVNDSKTNEKFALKQISLKNQTDTNNHKKQFEFLMKLSEENPELNIVKILGIEIKQLDKFNTVLYVLMEAGKSDWEKEIYQRNVEQRFYTEEELMEILTSLVATFCALQEKGISHRDVKPQNIVYFEKNKITNKSIFKITDFGEAKINEGDSIILYDSFDKNTSKQTVRGTELYMSPLLFNALTNTFVIDVKYNPYKSDIYSLGLCMIIDLIINILQINEKCRPDFIELNSWINTIMANKFYLLIIEIFTYIVCVIGEIQNSLNLYFS